MDQSERARLRALMELAPVLPWDAHMDEEHGVLLIETEPRGDVPVACVEIVKHRGVQLLLDAVNALPALLDDLTTAERERDEARAEAERLRAIDQERREISPLALEAVRTVAREEEREACAKVVEGWLDEVRRVTHILVGAGITDGPAVDALRAAAGVLHGALDDIRARGAGDER